MSKEDVDIYNMYGKDSSISKNEFFLKLKLYMNVNIG